MAFLDNPTIILAHIRQSHVTSDDTGMCEMVLIDQDVDLEKCPLALLSGSGTSSSGGGGGSAVSAPSNEGSTTAPDGHSCDLSQSMDITSSWDFGIRRRSNTGMFLLGSGLVFRAFFCLFDLWTMKIIFFAYVWMGFCVFNLKTK